MKKTVKRLAAAAMALMFVIPLLTAPSFAASSVSITGGDSVSGGETFTVTVTYSGDSVGRVIAGMTYDPSMISYLSGGSSLGDTGYIQLENAGTGEDIKFDLKFQALKEGSTSVNVETREVYDLDENFMGGIAASSKSISISGNAEKEELVAGETVPQKDYEPDLISVDEKEPTVNTTLILVVGAVILAILITVIAIIIRKKK